MAGYTDRAFRTIAADCGADFAFTEMVSAEAVKRGNAKTIRLAMPAPGEVSAERIAYGIQIFTGDAVSAAAAVTALAPTHPALFDINCGCSVPKILKSGSGARLLQEPKKIGDIVRAMTESSPIPVSVKLRLGWDSHEITYLKAADEAAAAGACLITLHPRTRAQGFGGRADWSHIKILKERLGALPVIGSGDLFSPEDALRLLTETGCDGVMFARGAIGNPFIFEDTRLLLEGRPQASPRPADIRLHTALRHLGLLMSYKPEPIAAREMRKHFARYAAGLDHAAALRRAANVAASLREYELIVDHYLAGELTE
ncbi:MAG: tRNA-dihydrouridine synthase [Spirochaetales bacterium]|nr:tRNA-dihydrouridine synthase [Spirochaetales bacterium]